MAVLTVPALTLAWGDGVSRPLRGRHILQSHTKCTGEDIISILLTLWHFAVLTFKKKYDTLKSMYCGALTGHVAKATWHSTSGADAPSVKAPLTGTCHSVLSVSCLTRGVKYYK